MKISRALELRLPLAFLSDHGAGGAQAGFEHSWISKPAVDAFVAGFAASVYSEMAHIKNTDYDTAELSQRGDLQHSGTRVGRQVFYQVDKDWHYRKEERRWVPMNDQSGWYLCAESDREWIPEKFFIR